MPRNNPAPTLAEITYKYLGLHRQRARKADYEQMEQTFQKTLIRVRSAEEIRAALKLDKARHLPVTMKSPAYERLLTLSGRSVSLLREYAQELYEFGPEFAHYADMLWDEANALEGEEN